MKVVDQLPKWKLLIAQLLLPLIIASPLYCIFDFQYGLQGTNVPMLLGSADATYDAAQFLTVSKTAAPLAPALPGHANRIKTLNWLSIGSSSCSDSNALDTVYEYSGNDLHD
ncbi:hypothetical protein V3C99_006980 [Haemonchus contortus]